MFPCHLNKEDLETKSLHVFVKVEAWSPSPNLIVPLGHKIKKMSGGAKRPHSFFILSKTYIAIHANSRTSQQ